MAREIRSKKHRPIPVSNEIGLFMHCTRCVQTIPDGKSARDWAQLEVGWTRIGLQIWCKRHEVNVVHVDFEGQKHPASMDVLK